jgi:hypothetical protein
MMEQWVLASGSERKMGQWFIVEIPLDMEGVNIKWIRNSF